LLMPVMRYFTLAWTTFVGWVVMVRNKTRCWILDAGNTSKYPESSNQNPTSSSILPLFN
jgi:hypothetical protein